MAIKFEKIQPGMILYDRHRYKMGNTTMSTIGEWSVKVISVDPAKRCAVVSWNGNREQTYYERSLTSLSPWSMYDKDVATYTKNFLGAITNVRRLNKAEQLERKLKADRELAAASRQQVADQKPS